MKVGPFPAFSDSQQVPPKACSGTWCVQKPSTELVSLFGRLLERPLERSFPPAAPPLRFPPAVSGELQKKQGSH